MAAELRRLFRDAGRDPPNPNRVVQLMREAYPGRVPDELRTDLWGCLLGCAPRRPSRARIQPAARATAGRFAAALRVPASPKQ